MNHCAASHNGVGGRPASARSRSLARNPARVSKRLPGEPEALAPTSNRKRPQEGHYISSMDGRAKGRKNQKQQKRTMNDSEQWQQHRAFGALDWASEKHSVVVVDQVGKVIEDFEIEHSALGWKKFREKLQPYGSIPFAIETSQGAAVEQLLEAGMIVYPLNPKSAQASSRTQSTQWGQRRSTGCLEFCRRLTGRWPKLESTSPRAAADQRTAFTLSG